MACSATKATIGAVDSCAAETEHGGSPLWDTSKTDSDTSTPTTVDPESSDDSLSSSEDTQSEPSGQTTASDSPAQPQSPTPEVSEDAFDKLGVSGELLRHWQAVENKSLTPPTQHPAAGREPLVEAKVRAAALWCMQQILVDVGLPMEAWFDAAALLDAYLVKASNITLEDLSKRLPYVVTVIARMMKKESTEVRLQTYNFNSIPALVAQYLIPLGFVVKVAAQTPDQELSRAEHAVLSALQWRVNLPTVASWTTAFFKRLDVLTENKRSEQVRTAWQRTLLMGQVLIAKQAPTATCSPQRLARGLLVLSMVNAESGGSSASPTARSCLEAAAGVAAGVLTEDCRLAVCSIQQAGYDPWTFSPRSEAPVRHASV